MAHRLHLHYQGEGSEAESEEDSTPSPGPAWVLASDEADTSTNEVEQLVTEPVRCTRCVDHSSGNSSHGEESEQLHAMHEAKAPEEREYRYTIRKPMATGQRPKRDARAQRCMAGYMTLNGFRAYTLFDSGSTTDSVSPQVTKVAKLPVFQLDNPVTLQLGCVGSRSKIFYGCNVTAAFGPLAVDHYFDVTNIDRYDCIVGNPWMREHGVLLDFANDAIVINGVPIPALTEGEEQE